MADFRLTQTGQQVQNDLNNAEQDNVTLEQHVTNDNIHVTPENKATWNGKYDKPSGGIPKSDLAEAVQAAVNAAMTAYQKPGTGIPKSDLASAVQTAIDAALTAYQKPGTGIPKTDLASAVQAALDAALTAYQKPNTGIPQSDMSADVQSKLNAAGSADAAIAAERLARETADLAINEALGTKVNATQVSNAIAAALADYDTSAEVASAISTAISTALANYYTKAQTYSQSEVDALIANFITPSVNNLVNYYLKSDTYTRAEVQALIDAVKQFTYVSVAELPTASADTMNKIYLVPSTNPKTKNAKDEFITIAVTDQGTTTYSWEQIGSTTIDLSNYYTIAQTDAAITAALNTALANYYTKTDIDTLLATKVTQAQVESIVASALASYSTTSEVSAAIASALTDYYTKTAIDAALAGKQATLQFDLTPTLNSSNPVTSEGIRAAIAAAVSGLVNSAYVQSAITTALADYSTTSQVSTMISTAMTTTLANYYTKDQVDGLVGGKYTKPGTGIPESDLAAALAEKINGAATQTGLNNTNDRVLFIERGLGKYDSTRSITLQQATAGKYVNVNGQEVSASGYGISAEVQLNAGDIMLVPSASAVPADVSLFARIVTRTYDKVISYTYTYRQDYPQLPLTATADYNPALIYTAQYDETGDTPVLTGWAMGGQTYTTLPATRTVTESYYEPLMKQAVAAMPSTGYYVYLCPTSMTIVVSGYTATVNGGVALVVGLGIFKNIATNFIGAPGQAVIAQAFAQLVGEIAGLKAQLDNLGETRAVCINSEDVPKVQNYPMIVYGAGAPSAPNVPAFIGQKYLDTTNKKEYTAFSVTNSVSDWVLMN